MNRAKSILALASGAALIGSAADASVIPYPTLVPVPHTAEQVADDPLLANYCMFDLQVVVSSATIQDRWASAGLRAQLKTGKFYIPPSNDSNRLQIPSVRETPGLRFLQMDNC